MIKFVSTMKNINSSQVIIFVFFSETTLILYERVMLENYATHTFVNLFRLLDYDQHVSISDLVIDVVLKIHFDVILVKKLRMVDLTTTH